MLLSQQSRPGAGHSELQPSPPGTLLGGGGSLGRSPPLHPKGDTLLNRRDTVQLLGLEALYKLGGDRFYSRSKTPRWGHFHVDGVSTASLTARPLGSLHAATVGRSRMRAQGTVLRSQGHLEQAGQVPGIDLQDVTQLQSPTGGYGGEAAARTDRGHHVHSSAVTGILKLVLCLSLNLTQVTSRNRGTLSPSCSSWLCQ